MSKFRRNRSVDPGWLNTPIKYCSEVKGKYTNPKSDNTREITDNFFNWEDVSGKISKSELEKLDSLEIWSDSWNDFYDKLYEDYVIKPYLKLHPRKKKLNKDFVIIEFYGKSKCLCAWRNNPTCKIGMTFLCPIIRKNKKYYVKYKNQLINLETKYGWVY